MRALVGNTRTVMQLTNCVVKNSSRRLACFIRCVYRERACVILLIWSTRLVRMFRLYTVIDTIQRIRCIKLL